MKEIGDIIASYDNAVAQRKRTALATVVHVEGSSYRRPGARMLVTEDGVLTGAISGGCLEGDALRKALLAIHQNQIKLVTYDTTDDDVTFGVQLGCNGIVHILFEPLDPHQPNAISLLRHVNSSRVRSSIITAFSFDPTAVQPGSIVAISNTGELFLKSKEVDDEFTRAVMREARIAPSENGLSRFFEMITPSGEPLQVFMQVVHPPINLIICGAGNDAQPLAKVADIAGWNITVIDGRKTHATISRFPEANLVIVSKAEHIMDHLQGDNLSAAVLMTHNYNYDIAALVELLKTEIPYIGILGPRKKLLKMFDDLQERGHVLTLSDKQRIFSPVGLDIGAETAEEIALSIAAEIKGVISGSTLQQLRGKTDPIHERVAPIHQP